ncbi:MAG: NfeD family protein [Pseudomonadota bacterium]
MLSQLLYWHWLVLGVALVVLEIFLASFVVLWFGVGALVVGLCQWLFPDLSFAAQLLIWLLASSAMAWVWFRWFKPRMVDRTRAGIAREALIGECGQVVRAPADGGRGLVRFSVPVLGSDEWEFICLEPVAPGDRVVIREFSGNTLVVAPAAGTRQPLAR